MNALPQNTIMGRLSIIEVYEFYDRPVLFACRNAIDTVYLAVLVEDSEDYDTWFYCGLSQIRFQNIRSGGIDLHDAFAFPEEGSLLRVRIPKDPSDIVEVDRVLANSLAEDFFPTPGECLNLETHTQSDFELDVDQKAYRSRRDVVRFLLQFINQYRSEAPAVMLGRILISAQETVTAIGQALIGNATERGVISHNIVEGTQLSFSGSGPGSFQFELISSNLPNLLGESLASDAIDEFILLLNLSEKPDELKDQLMHIKIRAASKYLSFLEALGEQVVNTNVKWSSPVEGRRGEATLSTDTVQQAIVVIRTTEFQPPEEFQVFARLIGANLDDKQFEIWEGDGATRKEYKGKVTETAMEALNTATLSRVYYAVLRKITKLSPMTGGVEEKYELVRLDPA